MQLQAQFLAYDCSSKDNNPADEPKDEPLITCDTSGSVKYILGPVALDELAARPAHRSAT